MDKVNERKRGIRGRVALRETAPQGEGEMITAKRKR